MVRSGRADIVITGASEILQKHQFAGFVRLGAVAPERCQPFDKNRKGIIIGEGAGVLVLESERHLVARGGRAIAEVGGAGLACDAHHITRPHPEGDGSLRAMNEAITRSGLTPADVDFISAHGTGTQANDPIESQVLQRVFDNRPVPVSSLKSMLGHCMGAASALEAIACILTVDTGVHHPTRNVTSTSSPTDRARARRTWFSTTRSPLAATTRWCASHAPSACQPPRPSCTEATLKGYAITGFGPVSPIGVGREAFTAALGQRGPSDAFRPSSTVVSSEKAPDALAAEVWDFDAKKYLGEKGLRNFDRLTKLMLVAARLTLEDSGLKRGGKHTIAPERVGVCSATAYGSLDAITELVSISELEDPRFVNPNRFPNTVINSAAGYVSIWEDLRAPNVTVVDGNCGALDAVLTGQTHLSQDRADAFLLGGGEALSEPLYLAFRKLDVVAEGERVFDPGAARSEGLRIGEGAAYVCMERIEHARQRDAHVDGQVLGYGTAFEPPQSEAVIVHASSRAVERAICMAMDDAELGPSDIDLVCASCSGLAPFDAAELNAIGAVLGNGPCVVAPKRLYGETFGAGGALALSATLGWLSGAKLGPIVRGQAPRETPRTAVVVAVGFYGNVSALVVSR
jgi:3-oxoacyl-[acyl-carrier-protein] synthase II